MQKGTGDSQRIARQKLLPVDFGPPVTVWEAARLFEEAGVARTERSIK